MEEIRPSTAQKNVCRKQDEAAIAEASSKEGIINVFSHQKPTREYQTSEEYKARVRLRERERERACKT